LPAPAGGDADADADARRSLSGRKEVTPLQQRHLRPEERCQRVLETPTVGNRNNKFVAGSRRTLLPATPHNSPFSPMPPIKVMRTKATKNNRRIQENETKEIVN